VLARLLDRLEHGLTLTGESNDRHKGSRINPSLVSLARAFSPSQAAGTF
jgi:hypothetical protein